LTLGSGDRNRGFLGEPSRAGRLDDALRASPDALELFARSLGPQDRVALEVTGGAWEIARILEGHVARVVVVSPDGAAACAFSGFWKRFWARVRGWLSASG
jgi:hypothetical protein